MARNSKKKLAIFAGTSKCLIYAEAKYCASEMPGEIKYYECSRTEYCCAFGCCVSPGLHFHHLWYYWILVIIMFLVCSGGGWWYRYWLQGRYRAATSAIPARSSNTRSQNSIRNLPYQVQQARITYNSARNTVLLHRMWKGPPRNTAAPAYNNNATTSTHYQNMNVVFNDANCPYYQLYGPPPSYETVIAQTRGKISSPTSPESSAARLNLPTAGNAMPNPSVPQCFFYTCNTSAGLVDGGSSQCSSDNASSRHLDDHESVPFAHFSQYYAAGGGAVGQNVCVPLEYPEASTASGTSNFDRSYRSGSNILSPGGYPADRLSDASDAENASAAHGYAAQTTDDYDATPSADAAAGGGRVERVPWNDRATSSVISDGTIVARTEGRAFRQGCVAVAETHASTSKSATSDEDESERALLATHATFLERSYPRERADYGGSLRSSRKHADADVGYRSDGFQRALSRKLSSSERRALDSPTVAESAADEASASRRAADGEATGSSQSNPSNNVILERFIFENAPPPLPSENIGEARDPRAMNRSTNFDLESKHKLDRSRSLD